MRTANRFLLAALVAACALLAGCGTSMRQAPSGFLSGYDGLRHAPHSAALSRPSTERVDPRRVIVAPVEWRVADDHGIDALERAAMRSRLHASLRRAVGQLPPAEGGRPVVIRAAITRVETVSAGFNTFATVMLIGPLDRGGAAVEIEALDADSRQQLAAMTIGYFAPITEVGARYRRLAPAEFALDKAASDFGGLLHPSR